MLGALHSLGDYLSELLEVVEVMPGNLAHDAPVDRLIAMHGDVSESHGFPEALGQGGLMMCRWSRLSKCSTIVEGAGESDSAIRWAARSTEV